MEHRIEDHDIALLRLVATEKLESAAGEERVVRYATATMLVREDGEWRNLATNIAHLDGN